MESQEDIKVQDDESPDRVAVRDDGARLIDQGVDEKTGKPRRRRWSK